MSYNKNQIWFAKIRDKKKLILKHYPHIDDSTGIYIILRYDSSNDQRICYIGQAKKILDRLANHLLGYQAIDLSIKKHGLYDKEKNPDGYKFGIIKHCDLSDLDEMEKYYINEYINDGWVLKNITGGGQLSKATDINQRKPAKGYYDGLDQGYKNCLKDVKEFFDKYLDFKCKGDECCYKNPDKSGHRYLKKIYIKKYAEFKEWLEK